MNKDLITICDLTAEEIQAVIALAGERKAEGMGRGSAKPLLGKSVAMIFEKASTRTRVSFEVAVHQLGGYPIFISSADSQMSRAEPIPDTARVLSRYVDGIVIRAYRHQDIEDLANWASVPVINALTDLAHPCQVLADLFTIVEKGRSLKGLVVAYIGDGNNVANSWVNAAGVLGFELRIACPKGYEPADRFLADALAGHNGNIMVGRDPEEAASGAQVLYTDVWVSMGQDAEAKEKREKFQGYQVNHDLIKKADPQALIMHCLPAHRGEEITAEALEGDHSVVFDQAENRLHVQKALLEILLAGPKLGSANL
jgi:ornithine carbamoyltransferase